MRVATIARSPVSLGHEYVGNEGKGKMLHLKSGRCEALAAMQEKLI
jgi:hypothetical protein